MNGRRMTDAYREDVISLVDVWRALVKHKKLIFLVWGSISLIGLAVAILMPEKYAYTTLIEVGGQKNDVVEMADVARARLLSGITPVIQRRYLAEGNEVIDVDVKTPEKSSRFVLLESKGTAQAASIHLAFQWAIVDALKDGHQAILSETHEKLATQQEAVQRRIAEIEDESTFLTSKLKRMDEEEEYLKEQIKQSKAAAAASKLGAKSMAAVEAAALMYMLTITLLEQQQRFLTAERAEINKAIVDNAGSVEKQRSALIIIASELGGIRETRAVIPPTRSVSPVAPDRKRIAMLAVFGGLMLGLLGVFLAEFFLKVRKETGPVSG